MPLDHSSRVYTGKGSVTMLVTMTCDRDTLVLALATLDGATEMEMILSVSHYPRWPRLVNSLSLLLTFLPKNIANVHEPL